MEIKTTPPALSPHIWTAGDGLQARREGWDLFSVRIDKQALNIIQRVDCPEYEETGEMLPAAFGSDQEVIDHLTARRDLRNDVLAAKALAMHGTPHVAGTPREGKGRVRTLIAVIEVQENERSSNPYPPTRSTMAMCIEGMEKDFDSPWNVTDVTVYGSFEDLAADVAENNPDLTTLRWCRPDEDGDDGLPKED